MGTILFWLHYIIAAILLYNILCCIYIKGHAEKLGYRTNVYSKADNDIRLKHPLWFIILFSFITLTPMINIIVLTVYLIWKLGNTDGEQYNKYYCKSLFTRKY